jgi:hypothetical protein
LLASSRLRFDCRTTRRARALAGPKADFTEGRRYCREGQLQPSEGGLDEIVHPQNLDVERYRKLCGAAKFVLRRKTR